jgi:cytochrome P450
MEPIRSNEEQSMANALTTDDPRYRELFDPAQEAARSGSTVVGDLTDSMSALRDQAPMMKGSLRQLLGLPGENHFHPPREHYTLLSFEMCERAFRANLIFSSEVYKESRGASTLGHTILSMIGEEHLRYRKAVQPMFLKQVAATWWRDNWLDEAITALVDRFNGRDTAELNMELCARLPVYVVSRGMGLSGDAALTFRENLLGMSGANTSVTPQERARAASTVYEMLNELITARRQQPRDDVVSGLIRTELRLEDGSTRKLTDEEIFSYCRLIILAGGGTTWRQLGITLHALLTHYELWRACRDDRSLVERAIDEVARWRPTDPVFPRLMTRDVEVDGFLLPKGARVDVCLGAANRDPAQWKDPDRLDISRPSRSHLAFGSGPHRCLGIYVAMQEMACALNALMDRFPNMRLDEAQPPPRLLGGLEQRGMSAVPVRLH